MKITRELIIENFSEREIKEIILIRDKFQETINYLKHNDINRFNEYIEKLGETGRNLMLGGELSDEIIEANLQNGTNCDRTFEKSDGTIVSDTWQTTFKLLLMKYCTEVDSIIYFDKYYAIDIDFNPYGTNIQNGQDKPTSDPDFKIKVDDDSKYLLEQKCYINRDKFEDTLFFKTWQFDKFEKLMKSGYKIYILHKYYNQDHSVYFRVFDFNNSYKSCTWVTHPIYFKNTDKLKYEMRITNTKPILEFSQDWNMNLYSEYIKLKDGMNLYLGKETNTHYVEKPF